MPSSVSGSGITSLTMHEHLFTRAIQVRSPRINNDSTVCLYVQWTSIFSLCKSYRSVTNYNRTVQNEISWKSVERFSSCCMRADRRTRRSGAILIGAPQVWGSAYEYKMRINKIITKSNDHRNVTWKWLWQKHCMIIWSRLRPMWEWEQFNDRSSVECRDRTSSWLLYNKTN